MEEKERTKWYFEKQEYSAEEECQSWKSWQLHSTNRSGYSSNEITFNQYDNGNISLWDDNEGVFIPKEQIKYLLRFLKEAGLLAQ